MTDVTFETAASAGSVAAPVAKRGFWRRLFEAMVEARMGQARAMIERRSLDQMF